MRIGIEAQRLLRSHKHGMDRVALELIRHLQVIDKVNEYFIFVKPDFDKDIIAKTDNFNLVEIPGGPYPIWEQYKLPRVIKKYNCDILHCTGNTAPLNNKVPLITTLHDIIFKESSLYDLMTSSASWYQKLGNFYRRIIVKKVVERSKKLITVSNFEKENISNHFNFQNNNLITIHNGVNVSYKNYQSTELKDKIRRKYSLPQNYLLHIGNTDPRKNTKGVIKAFYKYAMQFQNDIKLVIVGLDEVKLKAILSELDPLNEWRNNIVLTGYVVDEDLPIIFNMAQIFLFPSLREGFGIPIIEAMASGIPVITSKTSSMPEVAGNAALFVNPEKADEICNGINKILTNHQFKRELIDKGLDRSKLFSWEKSAKEVLKLYKQLYKEQKLRNDD